MINKEVGSKTLSILLCFLLLLLYVPFVGASDSSQIEWMQQYTNKNYTIASEILQTSNGSYLLVGVTGNNPRALNSKDFWAATIDRNGSLLWNTTYGGTKEDEACSVVQTDDGGYVIVGHTNSYANRSDYDILLIKIDGQGEELWSKTFGGVHDDQPSSLIQTDDNGFCIIGTSEHNALLVKTDQYGNISWIQIYETLTFDRGQALLQDDDGGYLFAGVTTSTLSGQDFWLVKTDQNGTIIWNQTYGGQGNDLLYDCVRSQDGGLGLLGETNSFGAGNYDIWLVKTDRNGSMQWNQTYGGRDEDTCYDVVQTSDGGFAFCGRTKYLLYFDTLVMKTDRNGYVEWREQPSLEGDDAALSLISTDNEDYVLAGFHSFKKFSNALILKRNSSNTEQSNLFPRADAGKDGSTTTNQDILLNGSGIDVDGHIVSFRWDVDGDGLYDSVSNSTGALTQSYTKEGIYQVFFTIEDNQSAQATDMIVLTIESAVQPSPTLLSREALVLIGCVITILVSSILFLFLRNYQFKRKIQHIKMLRVLSMCDRWFFYLIYWGCILVVLKILINYLFQMPVIYYDEFSYAALANDIFHGHFITIADFQQQVALTHPYPAGYSYFLAPSYILGTNMGIVYHGMLFINALLSTAIIIPIFFIMKRFVSKQYAFLTAIIASVIPAIIIHNFVLFSENAFYFIFLLSCLLVIKMFSYQTFNWKFIGYIVLLGFCIRFLILIKSTGYAMLAALFFVIIYKIGRNRNKFSLSYLLALLPSSYVAYQFVTSAVTQTSSFSNIGYEVTKYVNRQVDASADLFQFIQVFLNEISYLFLFSLIIFSVFTLYLLLNVKKIEVLQRKTLVPWLIYGALSILFLILITTNHIYPTQFSIYTRYVSIGLPLIFMFGFIGFVLFNKRKSKNTVLQLGCFFALFGLFSALIFPLENYKIENNLDLVWINSLKTTTVFNVDGFLIFRFSLAFISLLFLLLTIIVYFSKKDVISLRKTLKIPLTIIILFFFILVAGAGMQRLITSQEFIDDTSGTEPGQWLMNNDPHTKVVLEDYSSALYGGGMYRSDWKLMYASLFFWFPEGSIIVYNRSELHTKILSQSLTADYILSTHDLTPVYQKVVDIEMSLPVSTNVRQETVDWHIYKII